MRVRGSNRGFSLIEILATLTLVIVVSGLSLYALKPGQKKTPSRGLSVALAEELRAARQIAIAEGHPVAVGIPTDNGSSPAATSLYRLEGWDKPQITWSRNFAGDYPREVFLPATWSGPSFTLNAPSTAIAKFVLFNTQANVDEWIPDNLEQDYIFLFAPDGSLFGNGLPAYQGQYTLVVGTNLGLGSSSLSSTGPPLRSVNSGDSAVTILVSPAGGVTTKTGLPGGSLADGAGNVTSTAPPRPRTTINPSDRIQLSQIQVQPAPDPTVVNRGFCVPGQFVTFEVFARDPAGRELFARWSQGADKGVFTYPDGDGTPAGGTVNELDRMEYVADYQWQDGSGEVGAYRARWSWTVPLTTSPGDTYQVNVDVSDATGTAQIQTPQPIVLQAGEQGRMLVERLVNGEWKLFAMNPDGTAEVQLTPEGVSELMPSVDRVGNKMAFIEQTGGFDTRRIRIRSIDGSFNRYIDDGPPPPGSTYTSVAISPSGEWVSYRESTGNGNGTLHTVRVNGNSRFSIPQTHLPNGPGSGHVYRKSRTGFDPDSRFMFFEQNRDIHRVDLSTVPDQPTVTAPADTLFFQAVIGVLGAPETMYAPTPFTGLDGNNYIMFSVGNNDPRVIFDEVDYAGPPVGGGSMTADYTQPVAGGTLDLDDDYPSVSTDGRYLSFTQSPQSSSDGGPTVVSDDANQTLVVLEWDGANFSAPITVDGDVRRAVWFPHDD